MTSIFADTNYWAAKINRHDQWHERAIEAEYTLGFVRLVTTESVLIELLNYFSSFRANIRDAAAKASRDLLNDPDIEVIPHNLEHLQRGLTLYEARHDKGYSLTDCISMNVMRDSRIQRVLTHDKHSRKRASRFCCRCTAWWRDSLNFPMAPSNHERIGKSFELLIAQARI